MPLVFFCLLLDKCNFAKAKDIWKSYGMAKGETQYDEGKPDGRYYEFDCILKTSFSYGLFLSFWRVLNKHNSYSQTISSMPRNTGSENLWVLGSLISQNRESTCPLPMGTGPWPCWPLDYAHKLLKSTICHEPELQQGPCQSCTNNHMV